MNPTPPPPPPPPGASFRPSHPPNPPPPPSLTTALSELTFLLDLTDATLRSLPTPIGATTTAAFVPCPFNPNHRVPPSSLFFHYLNCPAPLSLHHTFHYPLTLRSTSSTNPPPALPSDSSDLKISLDNYIAYNSHANSFFYQNCPGPVTLTPSVQRPPSLSLPRVLYVECAEFEIDSSLKGVAHFDTDFIQFLPSEIWAVRSEIEAWGGGFPAFYSSTILRAVLRLKDCKLFHLYEWIIANSPRYGVIIDLAMRDHVIVLVKLCLKAIVKEAFELSRVKCGNGELEKKENVLLGLGNQSFECPVLVKVMTWLAFQFSILYGEVNGKFFAVDVLKECISYSASRASLFPLDGKDAESSDKEEPVQSIESINDTKRDEKENIKSVTLENSEIFISEVAAAAAALQERLLIEEKIRALRYPQPLSAYQRNMEHAHFSKLVDEERQRREDYRPIIENDGFFRQRSNNQEANKVKTREELLAEERDYKRRRMSYRGKKHKRNPVEVMRGIIEEYMEEARQAGGIGGTSEAGEVTEAMISENLERQASATYVSGPRRISETPEVNSSSADYRKDLYSRYYSEDFKDDNQLSRQRSTLDRQANGSYISGSRINSETHEENRRQTVDYRRDSHSRHHSEDFKDDRQRSRKDSTSDYEHQFPNRNVDNVRYDRDDYSGSRDGYSRRSHERTNEALNGKSYKRSRDEHERHTHRRRDEQERTSHKRERGYNNWEDGSRGRKRKDSFSRERDEDQGGDVDRKKSKTDRNSTSRHELHEFEDRYNPAVSHD